ncbi:MAG TPA: Ig-like domain-containing protein, partial [Thermosynechococcaceae cyanobacterium]
MPDIAGNSLGTATPLNLTAAIQGLQDTVTLTGNDFYRFVLSYRSSLNVSLTGLSANATLSLLDRNGNPLQNVANPSTFAESLTTPLEAGIYYLRVAPEGSTPRADYTLNLSIANTLDTGFALRNAANGENVLWQITGGALTGIQPLPSLPDINWQLRDTADFNGDGNPDLVWRNVVSGTNTVWFLNGTTYIGEAPLPSLPDTNWQLQGTGDFNDDGNLDLVWRNVISGTNTAWFLNGTTYIGEAPLPSLPDTNWQFQGTGDFNGDRQPDLLIRNSVSGANTIWLLNGTTYIGEASLPEIPDTNWKAKSPFVQVGPAPVIDTAGNSVATAFNLGSNPRGNATYGGAIGVANADDYYQFSIANLTNLSLSLAGLTADLDLQLLDPNGAVLQASALGGVAPESITRQLNPGTYLARVFTTGGSTSPYTLSIGLGSVPVLVRNAGLSLTEGGSVSLGSSLLSVTDPDVTTAQILYTLGNLPTAGSLSLNGAALLAGGRFSQADLDSGTRLTYSHNGSETTADSFSFTVADGVGGTIGSTPFTIGVTPVNDAPVLTVPTATQAADQGASVAISGISITDVDVATGEVTATLTANNGTVSLSSIAGLRFTQGDGTQDAGVIFSGSLSAVNAALQTLFYRSGATFSGTDTVSLRLDDNGNTGLGGNLSDSKTIAVQVTPVNRPPVITLPAALSVREDTRLTIPGISIADPDAGGGNVTASLSVLNGLVSLGSVAGVNVTVGTGTGDRNVVFSGPTGAVNAALSNLSYLGNTNFNGTDSILLSVSDNGNTGNGVPLSDQRSLNILVTPVNDAPVLNLPSVTEQVLENSTLSLGGISVQDVDAGSGNLTVSLAVVNGAVSVTSTTGVTFSGTGNQGSSVIFSGTLLAINAALSSLSYRGNLNFSGSDSLTIDVSDNGNTGSGIALNDRRTIALDVLAFNSPPVIALPTAPAVNTATSAAIPGISISDPDAGSGNALVTIAAVDGVLTVQPSPNVTFLQGTTPTGSRLTFEGTLTAINQTLASLVYRSNPGFVGFERLTISVNDQGNTGIGSSLSDTETLFVSVGGATNQLPIALNDSASVNQNTTLLGASVLGNDRDPDNNVPLSAQEVSRPNNSASFTLNPDGTFTYTPRANFSGTDSFTYAARDQIGGISTPATVTISVLAVNQTPIANNDSYSVNANGTLPGNVFTNDSDPDNNLPLTAQVVAGPSNFASFSLTSNGTFTYTPRANFSGFDSFVYRVSDSAGALSNLATANIAVAQTNTAPIAVNDSFTSSQAGVITPQQSVLFNDTDVDSNSLTAVLVSNLPTGNGTVSLAPNGTFTYAPGTFTGTTSFTYRVSDGSLDSNTATVTIAVGQTNTAPTAVSDSYSVSRAGVITPATSVLTNDTDPDLG